MSPFFGNVDASVAALAASKSVLATATKMLMPSEELLRGIANEVTGEKRGSLTEAQLAQELGLQDKAPVAPRRASSTIVWWQERQTDLKKSIERRSQGDGTQGTSLSMKNLPRGGTGNVKVRPGAFNGNGNGKAVANGNGKGSGNGSNKGIFAANGNGKVVDGTEARAKAAGIAAHLGNLFSALPGPGSKGVKAAPAEEVEAVVVEEAEEEKELVMAGGKQGPLGGFMGLLKRK